MPCAPSFASPAWFRLICLSSHSHSCITFRSIPLLTFTSHAHTHTHIRAPCFCDARPCTSMNAHEHPCTPSPTRAHTARISLRIMGSDTSSNLVGPIRQGANGTFTHRNPMLATQSPRSVIILVAVVAVIAAAVIAAAVIAAVITAAAATSSAQFVTHAARDRTHGPDDFDGALRTPRSITEQPARVWVMRWPLRGRLHSSQKQLALRARWPGLSLSDSLATPLALSPSLYAPLSLPLFIALPTPLHLSVVLCIPFHLGPSPSLPSPLSTPRPLCPAPTQTLILLVSSHPSCWRAQNIEEVKPVVAS